MKRYLKQDSKIDPKDGGSKDTFLPKTTSYCKAVRLETVVLNSGLHLIVKGLFADFNKDGGQPMVFSTLYNPDMLTVSKALVRSTKVAKSGFCCSRYFSFSCRRENIMSIVAFAVHCIFQWSFLTFSVVPRGIYTLVFNSCL